MKLSTILTTSVAAASLLVSACTTTVIEQSESKNEEIAKRTDELFASSEKPLPSRKWPVQVRNDVWLGGEARAIRHGKPLPNNVENGSLELFSPNAMDITTISDLLSKETGIPISIAAEVLETSDDEDEGPTYKSSVLIDHKGKLSAFLNQVTNQMGLNWRYDGQRIEIYKHETRTYVMKLLPSTTSGSASISSSSSTSGDDTNSSSGVETSSEYSTDLWTEIVEAITSIVGTAGTVTSSKSMGTLSITGPNSTLDRVERYVTSQNQRLAKQVAVNVQVFNVSMSDSSELGTDLIAALANTDASLGFNINQTADLNGAQLDWTVLNPISEITNLRGVVQFLDSKGDVSVVTTANATTLNNVPTPIQVGNRRGYVSEISSITDDTGNVTETYSTSEIATGFNMQVLPRVMDQGNVALQYSITTAELVGSDDGFDTYTGPNGSVQLPNVNTRAFTQQVMIPSGSTLVLSGFEQTKSRTDRRGVGNAKNWLTGGRAVGTLERDVMVIMITPTVLQDGNAIKRLD